MRVCQGVASIFRGCVGAVGHGWRGRFPGRHELKGRRVRPCLVRLICEGWLPQDPCSSPGSHPRIGRRSTAVVGLPIALVRDPVDGDVTAFDVLVRAPAAAGWPGSEGCCGRGQFKIPASQQNEASSRAHATATVPVCLPRVPARCVQR